MTWYCPSCGCEMNAKTTPNPDGSQEVIVTGCHCGALGVQSYRPATPKRTDKCPPEKPMAAERSGAYKAPTN